MKMLGRHMGTELIDSRCGIIRRITPVNIPPQFPRTFLMRTSVLSDTTRFSRWPSDSAGAGYAFADETAARSAAIGESIERYCGNLVSPNLRLASFDDLRNEGLDAIDPETVALFSTEQYADPGFPFVPMTRRLPLWWTRGRDLVNNRPVWSPASLVWVSIVGAEPPHTNPIIQAGLAAGRSRAEAEWSALREVIERDTMTLAWHGRVPLHRIEPPPTLARLAQGPQGVLHSRFYLFPNAFGLNVVGALVRDESTGYLTLGMGAQPDPVSAVRKAFAEALQLQLFVAGYDDPQGPYMRVATNLYSPLQPWRPDRDYGNAYRRDLLDVIDYGCHLQLYLDPQVQRTFEDELAATVMTTVTFDDLAMYSGQNEVTERLTSAGHRMISVDVTTSDVQSYGWHAVRVIVPGLYSNSAAGRPFLGGDRLRTRLAGKPRRDLPLPH